MTASDAYASCERRSQHEVHEHLAGVCTGVVLCEETAENFHCDRLHPHSGRHAERGVASWEPDGTAVRWCSNSDDSSFLDPRWRPQYREPFAAASGDSAVSAGPS